MFVKVCGMRSTADIDAAVNLGYSAAGVVLHPQSPRYVSPENAAELALRCAGRILSVAVALRYEQVRSVEKYFDLIQLYEVIDDPRLIYASSAPPADGTAYRYFLHDTSMGSGEFTELPDYPEALRRKLIISGGLTPENVSAALRSAEPAGVDVSSGVERIRGMKDYELMERFINEVKK
jgi:phosphoribosylanthranilate isomerase